MICITHVSTLASRKNLMAVSHLQLRASKEIENTENSFKNASM